MSRRALFLFDVPRVERDGTPIQVSRRKAIALIAYLAATGENHSRDALAALLWPEFDQARARAALGTTLWALKKALGPGWLQVGRKTISLTRSADLWVDVIHFRDLLAECRAHGHSPEEMCMACLAPLTEAVELYRGDFMSGFTLRDSVSFDDWQLFQAESLRREMVNALEKLVRYHSAEGEFEQASAYAQHWLALEPLHEPAHRHLMQLYAWSDQRTAALRQYRECVQLLESELGVSPQETTSRLYQDIAENREPAPPFVPHLWLQPLHLQNLPAQPTSFLGRRQELMDIARLVGDPACRLLCLVGPGGIGKTRLALQAAAENARVFRHGMYFVSLAPLHSADLIIPTVADVLKFSFQRGVDPTIQLLDYLREKEMLLVLDNIEHLLDGAYLLSDILCGAPRVKLLVTSRERLNLQWERFLEVKGLSFPKNGSVAEIEDYSAVQLFLQNARRVQPGFALSEEEKPYVVRICEFLEGMPLGIELAAAWAQVLSCREIAEEIERNLGFLTTALQDVPERHRSLRAVFDHSWNLLSEEERGVFSKLSVFRGGFRREVAESVAGATPRLLATLISKSFLRRSSVGRYEMLEVLRQYAEEKLQKVPAQRDGVCDRHCEYYAEFLGRLEVYLKGEKQKEGLKQIGEEIENVRAAWQWALARRKIEQISRSMESLRCFYEMKSWFQEGEEVLGKVVEELGGIDYNRGELNQQEAKVLAMALARQGRFCLFLSRLEEARKLLRASLSIFRHLDARCEMAFSLKSLGNVAFALGECVEARQLYRESLVIYRRIGDQRGVASCLNNLGVIALVLKEYTEAEQLYQQSLSLYQEIGDRWRIAVLFSNLGVVAEEMGKYGEAKRIQQKGLKIYKEIGDQQGIAKCLNNIGFSLRALGDYQQAERYFGQALETAIVAQAVPVALYALLGIATILMQEGAKEQALELVSCVLHHPSIDGYIRGKAEQLFSDLELQLSPQTVAMVTEKGKSRKLEDFAQVTFSGQRGTIYTSVLERLRNSSLYQAW